MDSPDQHAEITGDPFIQDLLQRLPRSDRDSFSAAQLLALKVALAGRRWGRHALDVRGALSFWRWRYYYVVVLGRERRQLSRRQEDLSRTVKALLLLTFLIFSVLLGLIVLYLVKSALGIDLIPGHSLGLWSWFKEPFR